MEICRAFRGPFLAFQTCDQKDGEPVVTEQLSEEWNGVQR